MEEQDLSEDGRDRVVPSVVPDPAAGASDPPRGNGAKRPHGGPRPYKRSGFYSLKRSLRELGPKGQIDRRTAAGRLLADWRREIVEDLGGEDNLSTMQLHVVDMATKSLFLLGAVDCFLARLPSPVDKRGKRLWPIVRERAQLADSVLKQLVTLGLEKRRQEISLQQYLESTYGEADDDPADAQDDDKNDDGAADGPEGPPEVEDATERQTDPLQGEEAES